MRFIEETAIVRGTEVLAMLLVLLSCTGVDEVCWADVDVTRVLLEMLPAAWLLLPLASIAYERPATRTTTRTETMSNFRFLLDIKISNPYLESFST